MQTPWRRKMVAQGRKRGKPLLDLLVDWPVAAVIVLKIVELVEVTPLLLLMLLLLLLLCLGICLFRFLHYRIKSPAHPPPALRGGWPVRSAGQNQKVGHGVGVVVI